MQKKNKLAAYVVFAVALICIIAAVSSLVNLSRSDEPNPSSASQPPSSVSQPADSQAEDVPPNEDAERLEIADPKNGGFEEILFDSEFTMLGLTDYQRNEKNDWYERDKEEWLRLTPSLDENGVEKTYRLGHKIYLSQKDGKEYVHSGKFVYPITGAIGFEGNGYFRTESGLRIHLFGSIYDIDAFTASWEAGQRILNGEEAAPENSIIFDGRLTTETFVEEDGVWYADISELAKLASSVTAYNTSGKLVVYVDDFSTVTLITDRLPRPYEKVCDVYEGTFRFKSWNTEGERFELRIPVLNTEKPLMRIKDMSVMFGWRMYTDGNALCIVTDPLNVSPLAGLWEQGGAGYTIRYEVGEDGTEYGRAYDSFGNFLWEIVLPEAEVAESRPAES